MTSLQEHVDELRENVDVEFFNPTFDPTVTVAVVRERETGRITLSDSRPENGHEFDPEYGRDRAFYTALCRIVFSRK